MAIEKFCTRCGRKFLAVGREVICPACKEQAAEESKKAAVMRAKRASWAGESVPVRISGRASTVIREYGATNSLPFAAALDALLKDTTFVKGMNEMGVTWDDIEPYRSHRRDKHATETETAQDEQSKQEGKQDAQEVKQETQAARVSKPTTASKASKASKKASSKSASVKKEG